MEDETDLYYGDFNDEALKLAGSGINVNAKINSEDLNKEEAVVAEVFTSEVSTKNEKIILLNATKTNPTIYPPPLTMPFLHLYPITNYTFGSKDFLMEIETSYHNRMAHLAEKFKAEGMRRTVEAVLITYENNHPHVLLLQLGDSTIFKLPGDTINAGEDEFTVLSSKLNEKLSPLGVKATWDIDPECLGVWYRPNFDNPMYPYIPAHVSRPKERITLFLVRLPPTHTFAVPKNVKMMAIPLCDLYDNAARYGPIISGLPQLLSKFNIIFS